MSAGAPFVLTLIPVGLGVVLGLLAGYRAGAADFRGRLRKREDEIAEWHRSQIVLLDERSGLRSRNNELRAELERMTGGTPYRGPAPPLPQCSACERDLLFSARQRGNGLCGPCTRTPKETP